MLLGKGSGDLKMREAYELYGGLVAGEVKDGTLDNKEEIQQIHMRLSHWANRVLTIDSTLDKLLGVIEKFRGIDCNVVAEYKREQQSNYIRLEETTRDGVENLEDILSTAGTFFIYISEPNSEELGREFEKIHITKETRIKHGIYKEEEFYCIDVEGIDDGTDRDYRANEAFREILKELAWEFLKVMEGYGKNIRIISNGEELKRKTGIALVPILGSKERFTIMGKNPEEVNGLYELVEFYRKLK